MANQGPHDPWISEQVLEQAGILRSRYLDRIHLMEVALHWIIEEFFRIPEHRSVDHWAILLRRLSLRAKIDAVAEIIAACDLRPTVPGLVPRLLLASEMRNLWAHSAHGTFSETFTQGKVSLIKARRGRLYMVELSLDDLDAKCEEVSTLSEELRHLRKEVAKAAEAAEREHRELRLKIEKAQADFLESSGADEGDGSDELDLPDDGAVGKE